MAKQSKKSRKQQTLTFTQTPAGYVVTGLVLLVVAYYLLFVAIDTGSLLMWLGTLMAIVWGLRRIIQAIILKLKK
jgi:protein-S-isoprenylcysteine O-methyltransferase Ste14